MALTKVVWTDLWPVVKTKINAIIDEVSWATFDNSQYVIVRTVTSGNLTVSLKNYLWEDPSAARPVKVQIWGVVRTITSALSVVQISGGTVFNSGSAELSTKEIDYFVYLFHYSNKSGGAKVWIWFSRVPSFNTISETWIWLPSSERFFQFDWDGVNIPPWTESVVNIGRFNAILSDWPGYTWSIPTTSVIISKPIIETRWLDFTTIPTSPMTLSSIVTEIAKYRIYGESIEYNYHFTCTSSGTASTYVVHWVPFSRKNTNSYQTVWSATGYDTSDFILINVWNGWSTNQILLWKIWNYALTTWLTVRSNWFYQI